MRPAARFIRWELLNAFRTVRSHPIGLGLTVLGLPTILAAYLLIGEAVAERLAGRYAEGGAEALTAALRWGMLGFAGIVVLMGAGSEIGSLISESERRMLQRCRRLPLSDLGVFAVRKFLNEGQMFAILVPMVAVVAWRLSSRGLPAGTIAMMAVAPCLVLAWCQSAVRGAGLVVLRLAPDSRWSWRSGVWLLIAGIAVLAQPATEVVRGLGIRTIEISFWPTDWVAEMVGHSLADRSGALTLLAGAIAATGACLALDFVLFRAIALAGFDRLGARAGGDGRPPGVLVRLLDRLPARLCGLPLRAWTRKEALRISADPVLTLTLQIPLFTFVLAFAVAQVLVTAKFGEEALPPLLATLTARAAPTTLGALLMLAAVSLPALLIPWEGRRLGAARAAPAGERELLFGKILTGFLISTIFWEVGYACVAVAIRPFLGSAWLTWAIVPGLIPFAAAVTAISGAALGSLFPNYSSTNPLYGLQLLGLGFHWTLALLAAASILAAGAAVAWFGPAYLLFAPALAVFWGATALFLCAHAERALRRMRVE